MLRDVTRLEAGSLLLDVSRLGNDNHSQIARIKKPDGSRAWDLETIDVSDCVSKSWKTLCHMFGTSNDVPWSTTVADDFKTFVISSHFHVDSP